MEYCYHQVEIMLGVRRKNVDFVGLLQNLRKRRRALMLD